jgi:hypothetical protein
VVEADLFLDLFIVGQDVGQFARLGLAQDLAGGLAFGAAVVGAVLRAAAAAISVLITGFMLASYLKPVNRGPAGATRLAEPGLPVLIR